MKEKLQFIHVILGVPTSKMAEISGVSFGTMQRIVSGLDYEPKNKTIVAQVETYLAMFNFPDVIDVPKESEKDRTFIEKIDNMHVGGYVEIPEDFIKSASALANRKSVGGKLFARVEVNGNIIIRRIR